MPLSCPLDPHRVLSVLLLAAAVQAASASDDADWPSRALLAVNQARLQQGQARLQLAPELQVIAMAHSADMAARGRLSHDGFQTRFERASSLLCVENVAAGSSSPATLVALWSRSPPHRRNLHEARVRRAGIADVKGYVTLFACE